MPWSARRWPLSPINRRPRGRPSRAWSRCRKRRSCSSILRAFLGYCLVVVGLLYDLGRPDRLWHPLVMWNPHSVMFEVAWCVTLYSTVLFLEFLPVVFEKFGLHKPLEWIHRISVPLMILGVLLSTLHQSSLGTLFLIVPEKLYPLWYTPILPLLFYISSIAVGL